MNASISMNRTFALFVLVCTVSVVLFGGGVSGSSFGLSVADSIETPEQTFSHDTIGTHTVNGVGVTTPGEPLSVSVTAPDDGTHFLDLYKGETRVDTVRIEDGSETVSIATDGLDPGTYILRLQSDGNTEAVFPAVINGYDINADHSETTSSDAVTVSTTVTPTASTGQPESVEAVVWNENNETRETLTRSSGESYEATLPLSEFDEDESYSVYVAAVSGETIYNDMNDILGIGESTTGENTDSDTDNDPSDGGTGGGGISDETDTDSDSETDDETDAENETEIGETNGSETTDDTVIQPSDPNEPESTDSTNETTGDQATDQTADQTPLSPAVAVVALVVAGLVATRRRQ